MSPANVETIVIHSKNGKMVRGKEGKPESFPQRERSSAHLNGHQQSSLLAFRKGDRSSGMGPEKLDTIA